ncbi:MAG: phosphatidylserine/phosphatidylglycerophosphate/cardiolipin synthase family protein [Acidobacteria bacterium]|nr:MAG: phosphatidylserine/phosphatidylglycerophosphate/cardiolipin synthase family protein [Acidobacteriota bacterium]
MNPGSDAAIPAARAVPLTAITLIAGLLLGCATADEPGNVAATSGTIPDSSGRERLARPSERDKKGYTFPVLSAGVALFHTLVSKPAARPLSSLHRLVSFVTSTTFDTLDPDSVVLTGRAPVPPLSQGRGMDLAAWEERLDELTGRAPSKGTIRFLVDGDEFFPRLVDAVEGAERSVDIRIYIFDNDDYATAFADRLKRRSEDVKIRVLVDGLGTLIAAGATPESTPPGAVGAGWIADYLERDSDVDVRVQSNPWLTGDHTKTIVVDNEVAFVGGMNIGREYRYDWHDLMMEVRGPVVGDIDHGFRLAWRRAGFLGEFGYLAESLWSSVGREAGTGYAVRMLVTKPWNSEIFRTQLAAIRNAERYIYIQNPYFSDDKILIALIEARRRGVDVRVILPFRGDNKIMDGSNVVVANTLFQQGVRVFIYPGFSHVKAAIFDGWACLGSANLDKMSLRVNEEMNLATSHPPTVAALMAQVFDVDFAKSAEMTEPLPQNLGHRLAALIANQL